MNKKLGNESEAVSALLLNNLCVFWGPILDAFVSYISVSSSEIVQSIVWTREQKMFALSLRGVEFFFKEEEGETCVSITTTSTAASASTTTPQKYSTDPFAEIIHSTPSYLPPHTMLSHGNFCTPGPQLRIASSPQKYTGTE